MMSAKPRPSTPADPTQEVAAHPPRAANDGGVMTTEAELLAHRTELKRVGRMIDLLDEAGRLTLESPDGGEGEFFVRMQLAQMVSWLILKRGEIE